MQTTPAWSCPLNAGGMYPKDLLYGETASEKRPAGCPQLHFKDICQHGIMALNIDSAYLEEMACNQARWRTTPQHQFCMEKDRIWTLAELIDHTKRTTVL